MTLYLPTDEEAIEGIGSWDYTAEPWCNHDSAAVTNGVCECGAVMTPLTSTSNLAVFEQDAQERYARLLRQHGNSGSSLVNGSVGATRIPASCVTCRQAVTVNRGAF